MPEGKIKEDRESLDKESLTIRISTLTCWGIKPREIAQKLETTLAEVMQILRLPKIKSDIEFLSEALKAMDPQKRFSSLLPKSIDIQEKILENENEKAATRLMVAKDIQERVLGKVPQTVDLGQNLIRALFEKMDQKEKRPTVIDISPEMELPKELPEIDFIKEKEDREDPSSSVDTWIAKNF